MTESSKHLTRQQVRAMNRQVDQLEEEAQRREAALAQAVKDGKDIEYHASRLAEIENLMDGLLR